jgi:uncharacterized Fe-S cluster-containing radical SAM superfamily enzyme
MKTLYKYQNGNTNVEIFDDGTKIRSYEEEPNIIFPESIDIKITNYCDMACSYCHESSTTEGVHGDLKKLMEVLEPLPSGVEIAIGGGNPLSHPYLIDFLHDIKDKGIIANLTVNQGHLKPFEELLVYLLRNHLIKGLGISITNNNFKTLKKLKTLSNDIVYHVIAGVNEVSVMDKLIEIGQAKVLVLGYKKFGFGVQYYNENVDENIQEWYRKISSYIGKCVLSFDNLAIEQLNIKRLFTDEGWERFYMGDDFKFTMYIDAVKQEFAPTSRSKERQSFDETNLLEYFGSRVNYSVT